LNRAQAQADLPIRLAIHPRGRGNNARSIELRNFGSIDAMNVQLRFLVFAYSVACRRSMDGSNGERNYSWKVIPRILHSTSRCPSSGLARQDRKAATCRTASDGRVFINLQPNAPGKSACTKQEPCTHALVLYADATHPKTSQLRGSNNTSRSRRTARLVFLQRGSRNTRSTDGVRRVAQRAGQDLVYGARARAQGTNHV